MMHRRADPHTLTGAYAMDAVDAADRARFEQHLASCESCRHEIRGLREAVALLAAATAVAPRPELREAVLRAAAHTRQFPPLVAPDGGQRWPRAGRVAGARTRLAGRSGSPWTGPPGRDAPAASDGLRRLAGVRWPVSLRRLAGLRWPVSLRRVARMSGARRVALATAGALAIVAVVLGAVSYATMQNRLDEAQGHEDLVAAVLSARDASMLTSRVASGGVVTIVTSDHMGILVLTAVGLRSLPGTSRYEVWLMSSGGTAPAGMLGGYGGGGRAGGQMVVSGITAGDRICLTVEPARGAPQPTSPPVVMVALT